jgi:DNA invertase Pin-like site-specific DNA recombinase
MRMENQLLAPGGPTFTTNLIPAAQYLRKSTDNQKYSIELQLDGNLAYATPRGIEIVRTYIDDGISGLTIRRREALQDLIEYVQSGRADFKVILVYDVSRWGRFQDVDESAYYEFICRSFGIAVHYCAELFENDGSFVATIAKNLKRAMAAEYSRELSIKVFAGHSRLVKLGYCQGGSPGYGLRRLLVDEAGVARFQLAVGQRKAIATDRVVLVPGPAEETDAVRRIFNLFVRKGRSEREIAQSLNRQGVAAVNDRLWTRQSVFRTLMNERYIGNYVWNQESIKLKGRLVSNAPDQWIRAEGVIEPIVARPLFDSAQEIIRERLRDWTEEEKLAPLRRLLRKHGFLSRRIIDQSPGVPSSATYHKWYGGLIPIYKLVGFTGHRKYTRRTRPFRSHHATTLTLSDDDLVELLRESLQKHGYLSRKIIDETEGIPSSGTYFLRFGSMKRVYELAGFPRDFYRPPVERAQRRMHAITSGMPDDQLLDVLRRLLQTHGYLTEELIEETEEVPSAGTYQRRFGSLKRAYKLIGFKPGRHNVLGVWKTAKWTSKRELLKALRLLLEKHGRLTREIIDGAEGISSYVTFRRRFGTLSEAYRLIGYKQKYNRK